MHFEHLADCGPSFKSVRDTKYVRSDLQVDPSAAARTELKPACAAAHCLNRPRRLQTPTRGVKNFALLLDGARASILIEPCRREMGRARACHHCRQNGLQSMLYATAGYLLRRCTDAPRVE
eukprot:2911175-Pleurochrysis_carterae.AAC.3